MKKSFDYYIVPDEFWFRIHFVRPRFKSHIENVLLYMANECCRIPKCSCKEYSDLYLEAIRMFPGNIGMSDKTLHNWRTEIPALFDFYREDKKSDVTETSSMAYFLRDNQDLTQFLRLFLYSFQFPGGHLKPKDNRDLILNGIKFKPAKTIIEVLLAGNGLLKARGSNKDMSLSPEEATYCIFNDTRVTTGVVSPLDIAETILENRKNKLKYYNKEDSKNLSLKGSVRSKTDVTRYAGDILDYMEIANLLRKHNGYFYLKENEVSAIKIFAEDSTWFSGYDGFYNLPDVSVQSLSEVEPRWFEYVNDSLKPDMFRTDIRSIISEVEEFDIVFNDRIRFVVSDEERTTKDIGNLGEAIVCSHEKMRLKLNGFDDFVRLVQIVDSPTYHPGFDIDSFEGDGTENHRYIEVKTTVSKHRIQLYGFHMSTNEWRVTNTIKEHYCVYRLMLSEKEKTLFILRDPVSLYKTDKIEAEPRDGMEISFSREMFEPTKILVWQK